MSVPVPMLPDGSDDSGSYPTDWSLFEEGNPAPGEPESWARIINMWYRKGEALNEGLTAYTSMGEIKGKGYKIRYINDSARVSHEYVSLVQQELYRMGSVAQDWYTALVDLRSRAKDAHGRATDAAETMADLEVKIRTYEEDLATLEYGSATYVDVENQLATFRQQYEDASQVLTAQRTIVTGIAGEREEYAADLKERYVLKKDRDLAAQARGNLGLPTGTSPYSGGYSHGTGLFELSPEAIQGNPPVSYEELVQLRSRSGDSDEAMGEYLSALNLLSAAELDLYLQKDRESIPLLFDQQLVEKTLVNDYSDLLVGLVHVVENLPEISSEKSSAYAEFVRQVGAGADMLYRGMSSFILGVEKSPGTQRRAWMRFLAGLDSAYYPSVLRDRLKLSSTWLHKNSGVLGGRVTESLKRAGTGAGTWLGRAAEGSNRFADTAGGWAARAARGNLSTMDDWVKTTAGNVDDLGKGVSAGIRGSLGSGFQGLSRWAGQVAAQAGKHGEGVQKMLRSLPQYKLPAQNVLMNADARVAHNAAYLADKYAGSTLGKVGEHMPAAAKTLKGIAGVGTVVGAVTTYSDYYNNDQHQTDDEGEKRARAVGASAATTGAGIAGGAIGAAIGSLIPGPGTVVGAMVGSYLGSQLGEKAVKETGFDDWTADTVGGAYRNTKSAVEDTAKTIGQGAQDLLDGAKKLFGD